MALWFYRGLRKGVVTTRYPKEVDPWTKTLPTPPAFHSLRLTSGLADLLAQECPAGAIRRDGPEMVVDLGRCTACGRCLQLGGDAVQPSGEFLLATGSRLSLLKRVAIGGNRDGGL